MMRSKRSFSLLCLLMALVMLFASCDSAQETLLPTETEPTAAPTEKPTERPDDNSDNGGNTSAGPCTKHNYVEKSRIDALALKD